MTAPACVPRRLSGWGRFPVEECCVYRPEQRHELAAVLAGGAHPTYIARGAGRSYGDAALNGGGAVVSHLRLNRLLAFDPATGVLECEAGTLVGDVVDALLPRGFFPPVTPGTRFVTIGGAIANDVHGKNHPRAGSFASSLVGLTLLTPEGREIACSPSGSPDVFWATVGGLGLTGMIVTARIRLRRVPSPWMAVDTARRPGLEETLAELDAAAARAEHAVAWVDCLARGRARGRGVVFAGDHAADGPAASPKPPRRMRVPFPMPGWVMGPASVRAFNRLYFARHPDGRGGRADAERFFYPLDAVGEWNRMYGRRGFAQYQCVVPPDASAPAFAAMMEQVDAAGHAPFLAVVKRMGAANAGLLSFPRDGFTLAMDLPVRGGLRELAAGLDRIVLAHGGRVYPGKDALLDADSFRAMYPMMDRFLEIRRELDPRGVLSSSLARRVGLA
jgi:decaprenylphospho-beta-D-ribofuranose 2-oxidase